MTIKSSFKTAFRNNWYFYILSMLAVIFSSIYFVKLKVKPRGAEIFSIVIVSDIKEENATEFYTNVKSKMNENVREFDMYSIMENESSFSTHYNYYVPKCDIAILPTTALPSKEMLLELPDSYKNSESYSIDGICYGILSYSKDTHMGMMLEQIAYTESQDYYIFINNSSYHIGALNNKSVDSLTFDVLDYLMTL